MLVLEDIHKTFFAGKPNEVNVLNGLNLYVDKGDFVCIVGANGSGKSTLLNMIAGTVQPDKGKLMLHGRTMLNLPDYKRSKWIARVFQNPLQGTASELSILDNFRLAALRGKTKGLSIGINTSFKQRVREQLRLLDMGLEDRLEKPMGLLSGGQRQALTMLMTVMSDVDILLLDEPTAALDPRSSKKVMEIANQLAERYHLMVILVTHNMKDALTYGNRLVQLSKGQVRRDFDKVQKAKLMPQDLYVWFNEE